MKMSMNDMAVLGPSQAAQFVARCVEAGITPFLHGRPGVGKTAIVEAVARGADVECRTLSLSLMQPEDLRVPVPTPIGVRWEYTRALPTEGEGILFLDEFPQAHESVQAALGQLLHLGRLDGYALPPRWAVVLAGNRVEDGAAAHSIPTQIRNRCAHVTVETSPKDWFDYDPERPPAAVPARIGAKLTDGRPHPILVALGQVQPGALATPDNWTERMAWPTPRTLSLASAYLAERSEPDEVDWAVVAGLAGQPLATELRAWWQLRDQVPAIEEVVKGKAAVPEDLPARWVAAMMVAEAAATTRKEAVVNAAMRWIAACGVPFLAVAGTRLVTRIRDAKIPGFIRWEGMRVYYDTLKRADVLP